MPDPNQPYDPSLAMMLMPPEQREKAEQEERNRAEAKRKLLDSIPEVQGFRL